MGIKAKRQHAVVGLPQVHDRQSIAVVVACQFDDIGADNSVALAPVKRQRTGWARSIGGLVLGAAIGSILKIAILNMQGGLGVRLVKRRHSCLQADHRQRRRGDIDRCCALNA